MKQWQKRVSQALAVAVVLTSVMSTPALTSTAQATPASTVTQAQALDFVKNIIPIPEGYKLQSASYQDSETNRYSPWENGAWMVTYINERSGNQPGWLNFNVDAKTGKLLDMSFYDNNDGGLENALPREQLQTKALEVLKKMEPDKVAHVQAEDDLQGYEQNYGNDSQTYGISFLPLQNGVPVDDAIQVTINADTGEWISLWSGQSAEAANATDIKGHYAEKYLKYFLQQGIFELKDGKVEPEAEITRGDAVRYAVMLVDGLRNYAEPTLPFTDVSKDNPNAKFIKTAYENKWLEKGDGTFRPNDTITREELAELATMILGYQALANVPNTFKIPFTDLTPADQKFEGDIGVVNALGLMVGSNNSFQPRGTVTRAQVAVVWTRLLDQLKVRP